MKTSHPAHEGRITLAAALASEAEELVALRIEAMQESLERIGRFDPVRARERFLSGFEPDFTRHIEISGRRVGFVAVKPKHEFLLLDHLYIRPAYQGRKIGSIVLTQILDEASMARISVRVGALRESDSNRFYIRHGFCLLEQSEFDNYYVHEAKIAA